MAKDTKEASQPTDYAELVPARNGALRDPKTGRIVANPPGGPTTAINPSNAVAMANKHWERVERGRLASRQAITAVKGTKNSIEAWAGLISGIYLAADNGEQPLRERVLATKLIGDATGYLPIERKQAAEGGGSGNTGDFLSFLRELRDILRGDG